MFEPDSIARSDFSVLVQQYLHTRKATIQKQIPPIKKPNSSPTHSHFMLLLSKENAGKKHENISSYCTFEETFVAMLADMFRK